jgi:hypothetical protein
MSDNTAPDIPAEIVTALGQLTISSGTLNAVLCMLFQWLLGAPKGRAAPLFYSASTMPARLELLCDTLRGGDIDEPTRERANDLIERARILIDRHVGFADGWWSVGREGSAFLISYVGGTKPRRTERKVNAEEVETLASDFLSLLDDLVAFLKEVGAPPL